MKELQELINKGNEAMDNIETARQEIEKTCNDITLKYYHEPVVRIYNNMQAFRYMKNGVKPIEIYPDVDAERIVFVFRKAETQELYAKWLAHEL